MKTVLKLDCPECKAKGQRPIGNGRFEPCEDCGRTGFVMDCVNCDSTVEYHASGLCADCRAEAEIQQAEAEKTGNVYNS